MAKQRQALGKGLGALIPEADDDTIVSEIQKDGSSTLVIQVSVDHVEPNPHQPREHFEEEAVAELAASIKEKGLLQPVSVRKFGSGYQLIAGERRLRASKAAGLSKIPAIVFDVTSDEEMMELSLIENVQREDLSPIEEAKAYRALIDECFLTQEEVAIRVSKDRSSVANTLRLLLLAQSVREALDAGKISMGHARALLGLEETRQQEALCRDIVSNGLSVRKVEALVRNAKNGGSPTKLRPTPKDPHVASLEENLRTRFGTGVNIKRKGSKGKIEIEFYSMDDLERLLDLLQS
ncbi:MAG: stage 0 sporulation protein J [Gemmatimonadetes bacterium]|nr:stage 0 sporulation protein J [Gemmatimonadota bacterium]HCK10199.1 stage 0 sporulation protein J [Candidatus Latescibacterota bacterium]